MNRREVITRLAILMGGTLSAQTLSAIDLLGSDRQRLFDNRPDANPFTLTADQRKIMAEVAEHIIPKTSTPGSKDAGVPDFIEMMLKDCYKKPEQESFAAGIAALEKQNFLSLSAARQVEMLKKVESDTKKEIEALNVKQVKVGDNVDKETMDIEKAVPFWRLIKELTLFGYFTSEVGANASFIVEPIPGKFEPIKIKPGQKLYMH
jgi:Gluconate 2-dehydrogenase subunit 3